MPRRSAIIIARLSAWLNGRLRTYRMLQALSTQVVYMHPPHSAASSVDRPFAWLAMYLLV
ncbi:Unknown protein sequence, partial [Pseudomonas syringae pv. spinaceae]